MKKIHLKKIIPAAILLCLVVAGCLWYVNDYYHSDESVQQYLQSDSTVRIEQIGDGLYLDGPGTEAALIFYPGAKVEYTAYAPLLHQLAEKGIDVFLIRMPCNLAFLGKDRADGIMEAYEYRRWYLGGHSLGGAMAAVYAAAHTEDLEGLVLLAAYPTESLRADNFSVLSLYGSEDDVLNKSKVEEGRDYMPEDYTEICIEGGNHAQFGNYGIQKGDGEASLSREEQQDQTVEAIYHMIVKQEDGRE